MPTKLLAIWLDAAEPAVLEPLMACGDMPNLAKLRSRGAYGRLVSIDHTLSETVYGMVLTGQPPQKTGTWTIGVFDPQTYSEGDHDRTGYGGVPFFLEAAAGLRTCVFDIPCLPVLPGLNGIQLCAWGAHSPRFAAASDPPELFAEVTARHGEHPAGSRSDYACLHDPAAMRALHGGLLKGLARRGALTCDLLGRESWDLFFMSFGELHAGGHHFVPHPDCRALLEPVGGADALPALCRAVDHELGRIIAAAGPCARVAAFSTEGMAPENFDVANFVLLPELLFRYSFPGCVALDFDPRHGPSPQSRRGVHHWAMEVWHQRRRPRPIETWLRDRLPLGLAMRLFRWLGLQPPLFHPSTAKLWRFQPTTWMAPYRPYMKAFALITASDGFIRLNVRGRERRGMIAARHFGRACDEITELLLELREPRTGRRAVRRVIRMRNQPHEGDAAAHPADLVVIWDASVGARLDSPRLGQLGPAPFHRTSTHSPDGFLCAAGPGIAAGALAPGTPLDVAPTLLRLAGVTPPAELPGRCLVAPAALGAAA